MFSRIDRFLYTHILPKYGITHAHYRCDGAGCFVASNVKAFIAQWEKMTGIVELSYKNLVPGKGKTSLDGLFGILTYLIHQMVDKGGSFTTASELYELLTSSPLRYTEYHLLKLDREKVQKNGESPRPLRIFLLVVLFIC